jgi:hypothetical protein
MIRRFAMAGASRCSLTCVRPTTSPGVSGSGSLSLHANFGCPARPVETKGLESFRNDDRSGRHTIKAMADADLLALEARTLWEIDDDARLV